MASDRILRRGGLAAFALTLLVALGGCGIEGKPERPQPAPSEPGLSVSGTAEMGVVRGNRP
ncbi:argininosuccinate lyase [Rhodovulum sp. MB263]|uniref:argininosuccinate lyase n=1 Tax=Rhodovulum sp. (strain MB263) TaxID=308754 RepID=UPI0012DB14C5|nr:argininosuccinate lyase [Rhodovulum sp. MB263]